MFVSRLNTRHIPSIPGAVEPWWQKSVPGTSSPSTSLGISYFVNCIVHPIKVKSSVIFIWKIQILREVSVIQQNKFVVIDNAIFIAFQGKIPSVFKGCHDHCCYKAKYQRRRPTKKYKLLSILFLTATTELVPVLLLQRGPHRTSLTWNLMFPIVRVLVHLSYLGPFTSVHYRTYFLTAVVHKGMKGLFLFQVSKGLPKCRRKRRFTWGIKQLENIRCGKKQKYEVENDDVTSPFKIFC